MCGHSANFLKAAGQHGSVELFTQTSDTFHPIVVVHR